MDENTVTKSGGKDTAAEPGVAGRGREGLAGPAREVAAASAAAAAVYTAPALDEATALLADLYAAGDKYGIRPGDWAGQGASLPDLALRAVAARYRRAHSRRSPQQVRAMYRRLETALAEAGITPMGVYRGRIVLPRFETTPQWGWSGEAALTVGFYTGDGWTLELAQERTPVVDVVAVTEDSVAELVADVLTGRRPDPLFPGPRR